MAKHKLSGCTSRALFQIDRAKNYLDLVTKVIPDDDADPNRQFLYQSMVFMLQSYFEEYLRCIVAIGTFWRTPAVRLHLQLLYKDQDFASMPGAEVEGWAQQRVSFDDRASRLKAIMQVIADTAPFADIDAEEKCMDFVNIRNIVAHRGGWPDDANVPTVRSPDVIVETNVIGTSRFYKLEIRRGFFVDGLSGIVRSILGIETALAGNPDYRL
jgi:hypothetical protein